MRHLFVRVRAYVSQRCMLQYAVNLEIPLAQSMGYALCDRDDKGLLVGQVRGERPSSPHPLSHCHMLRARE